MLYKFGASAYNSQTLRVQRLAKIKLFHHKHSQSAKLSSKPQSKKHHKHHQTDKPYVKWDDKKDTHLNQNGVASMALQVSPDTHVEITGQRSGQVYKDFTTQSHKKHNTIYYNFKSAGTYHIKATRNGKQVTKEIVIKPQESSLSSSSSSSGSEEQQSTISQNSQSRPNAANNVAGHARNHSTPVSSVNNYRRPINNQFSVNSGNLKRQ
ncbi:hypothetical protein [Limosilactobacillus frumenti]|uniref:hypothetical protein n=1 Tax=Limosilactobacillus frumenti TaxID=104955 RepID=UPI0015EC42B5|nr:hypothetical protein [Limosilactobacillus frumenti]MBA2914651.1 hypothetical protein [Limosilactobacillus frumenti]